MRVQISNLITWKCMALVSLAISVVSVGLLISEKRTASKLDSDRRASGLIAAQGKVNICLSTLYDLRTNGPGYMPEGLELSLDCEIWSVWLSSQHPKQTDYWRKSGVDTLLAIKAYRQMYPRNGYNFKIEPHSAPEEEITDIMKNADLVLAKIK